MNYIIRELRDPDSYNSCLVRAPKKRNTVELKMGRFEGLYTGYKCSSG